MAPSLDRPVTDTEVLVRLLTGACEVDERLLADLLAEGVPFAAAARRATRGRWRGGAAILLGGVIALSSARAVSAHEPAAPVPAPAPAAATSRAAGALASVAAKLTTGASATAAPAAMAEPALPTGITLLIPAVDVTAQAAQTYQVQSGDTLSGIAYRFYGNAGAWPTIYYANTGIIADPNLIYPGQVFSIPSAPTSIGTQVNVAVTPGSQTGQGIGQYTVRSGDSLWSIAQLAYGNPYRWADIYNANIGVIGADPSLIYAGTLLTIPA